MAERIEYSGFTNETGGFIDKLNRVTADVALRLAGLEKIGKDLADIERRYGAAALARIDEVVKPIIADAEQRLLDTAALLHELLTGTVDNAEHLGGEGPAHYLDLGNATGILPVERGGYDSVDVAITGGSAAGLDTVGFTQTSGDKISLYGDRFDQLDFYGFGVEANTTYYRSANYHRWYSNVLADGVSWGMQLDKDGRLEIKHDLVTAGNILVNRSAADHDAIIRLDAKRGTTRPLSSTRVVPGGGKPVLKAPLKREIV